MFILVIINLLLVSTSLSVTLNEIYGSSKITSPNGYTILYVLTNYCFSPYIWFFFLINTKTIHSINFFFKRKLALTSSVYFLLYKKINTVGIIKHSYVFFNIGLSNKLGQYHPPILYIFAIFWLSALVSCFSVFLKKKNKLLANSSIYSLVLTISLSMLWADQELFWGSFWNWDSVEMISLTLPASILIWNHASTASLLVKLNFYKKRHLCISILSSIYIVTRGPISNSIHQFSNSPLIKLNKSLYFIYVLSLLIIITLCLDWNTFLKKYKYKFNTSAIYKFLVLILIYSIFLNLSAFINTPEGLYYKRLITFFLLIKFKTGYFNYKKDLQHLFYILSHSPLFFLWLYKTNSLYKLDSSQNFILFKSGESNTNLFYFFKRTQQCIYVNKLKLIKLKSGVNILYGRSGAYRLDFFKKANNFINFFSLKNKKHLLTLPSFFILIKSFIKLIW